MRHQTYYRERAGVEVSRVLAFMQDGDFIKDWQSAGSKNRHDYSVTLPDGRVSVIELKGCLDGNNTAIFERPSHAQEFIIWSVCSNGSADPRLNVWSGIHTLVQPRVPCRSCDRGSRDHRRAARWRTSQRRVAAQTHNRLRRPRSLSTSAR